MMTKIRIFIQQKSFKIYRKDINREQIKYIREEILGGSRSANFDYDIERSYFIVTGNYEQLFCFLREVAAKYDVELI